MTHWERCKLVFKVVEVRLRFVAVLVVTAAVIGNWDTLQNRWQKWTRAQTTSAAAASDVEYFCPMHPSVVRATLDPAGKIPQCPICGMPLSTRRKGSGATSVGSSEHVQLSPERITLAHARTEVVGFRPLAQETLTSGSVQYDEGRLSRIVARVNGYLEKLIVDKTFVEVKVGEPLAELYSPELYTTVKELLLTRGDSQSATNPIASASRERLHLLGIDEQEIDRILTSGKSDYRIVIRSPQSGHVIRRDVVEGSYVTVGTSLFEIADLSKVWIEADVFERDIPLVRKGGAIEAWVDAVPNHVFTGEIGLVHPHVNPTTRTNTVRFTVANPDHELRPGMFATVRLRTPIVDLMPWKTAPADSGMVSSGSVLAIPERAVIDTGSKKVVYVETEPGLFVARRVELGPRVGEWFPAFAGICAGERVASAGAFLIDAETRLHPAEASTSMGSDSAIDTSSWKELSPEDRALAATQRHCPVSHDLLGVMGTPFKTTVAGKTVFLCCGSCKPTLDSSKGAGQ